MSSQFWIELAVLVVMLLTILSGQTILWTRFKTLVEVKMQAMKEEQEKQEKCIAVVKKTANANITMPQHDKMQVDCQKAIYKDITNITRSVDDLRHEQSDLKETVNSLAVIIEGLRVDIQNSKEKG